MSADPGVSAFPDGDNLFKWIGTIEGGSGTVSLDYFFLSQCNAGEILAAFLGKSEQP